MNKGWIAAALLGLLAPCAHAAKVVFDEGHGQQFTLAQRLPLGLSGLGEQFGAQELVSHKGVLDKAALADARVLVISGAFDPYSEAELAAIKTFVEQGGRLAVMLHVGPLNGELLNRFGVAVTNAAIREQQHLLGENSQDFAAARIDRDHPLFAGVNKVGFYGVWAIKAQAEGLMDLAFTSDSAWIDLNRNQLADADEPRDAWPLVVAGKVGAGKLAVFGDDAMFQNAFLKGDNLRLAQNLAAWLLQ
ncbi:DUF4350 domain-containing protein [Shewanella cyperi]|uniref:DUF4350 domain-containing protein n=1 Tax=Shewanella cyperi TaxID=2814292 RepID=A0A974XIY4_9GAMM|nr:DUF4350 domain-containing protein [Shewanella cyperi]QSX29272.1 DUF4350 domain-containing protein [Shewanella cyperi]